MKNKISILTAVFIVLFFSTPVLAQLTDSKNNISTEIDNAASTNINYNISDEVDAIAIRILPNPNHYNAIRWYKSQGFKGSPQSLMIDGYDAVRDGRTVYVNAANVDLGSQTIYTNIYLISYNQNPDLKTVDVLGQIIKNWRFNSNLTIAGQCKISTLLCQAKTDCSNGYNCVGVGEGPGRCVPEEAKGCYIDSDCSDGIYCNSLRAKVNRDVRRLGILGDLRESMASYKNNYGRYPVLSAGSYVPYHTVSTWPSWQTELLSKIAAAQTSVDPINALGICHGFDPITCWNEDTKKFADDNATNSEFELPAGSQAFVYSSDENGSNYNLCAGMETKELGYNTAEGQLIDSSCVSGGSSYIGNIENKAPYLMTVNLTGKQNQVFNGSIRVYDPENNYLTWSIIPAQGNWTGWSSLPIIQDTNNPNQKRIYAQKAGVPGIYNLSLSVSDGYGGTLSTVTPITIANDPPLIKGQDIRYYPSTVLPLMLSFSVTDADHPLSYTISKPQYNSGPYDLLTPPHSQRIGETSNRVGDTVNYIIKYNISTSNSFPVDENFAYLIKASDKFGNQSEKIINIDVKADPPALDFNCNREVRVGYDYYCGLGWREQGDHTITYTSPSGLPIGMAIVESFNLYEPDIPDDVNISKNTIWQRLKNIFTIFGNGNQAIAAVNPNKYYAIQGNPTIAKQKFNIRVRALNEFNAISESEFSLDINTYCGDGVLQEPNTESKGGLYNDGQESCDGLQGTTDNPIDSHVDKQYCCTTKGPAPYPVRSNNHCVFTTSAWGGGYCGDSMCATNFENSVNCPVDCGGNVGQVPILTKECSAPPAASIDD